MSPKEPSIKTADICDRFSSSVEVCAPIFKGYGAVAAFAGSISTMEVYEDNVLVREALEDVAAGGGLDGEASGFRRYALLVGTKAPVAPAHGSQGGGSMRSRRQGVVCGCE